MRSPLLGQLLRHQARRPLLRAPMTWGAPSKLLSGNRGYSPTSNVIGAETNNIDRGSCRQSAIGGKHAHAWFVWCGRRNPSQPPVPSFPQVVCIKVCFKVFFRYASKPCRGQIRPERHGLAFFLSHSLFNLPRSSPTRSLETLRHQRL